MTGVPGAGRLRWWAWGVVAAMLLLPLVAMRFTSEVTWTATDFIFAAVLSSGGLAALEIAVRVFRTPVLRRLASAAILCAVLLIWTEAAVGVF